MGQKWVHLGTTQKHPSSSRGPHICANSSSMPQRPCGIWVTKGPGATLQSYSNNMAHGYPKKVQKGHFGPKGSKRGHPWVPLGTTPRDPRSQDLSHIYWVIFSIVQGSQELLGIHYPQLGVWSYSKNNVGRSKKWAKKVSILRGKKPTYSQLPRIVCHFVVLSRGYRTNMPPGIMDLPR